MTLVILCRQIDISIGSQFCICGVVAGLLARAGLPMPLVGSGHAAGRGGHGGGQRRARRGAGAAVDRGDAGHAGDRPRVAPLRPRRASSSATCRRASSGSALGQAAGQWVVVAVAAGGLRWRSPGACGTWRRGGRSTPPAPTPRPRGWRASGPGGSSSRVFVVDGGAGRAGRLARTPSGSPTSIPTRAAGWSSRSSPRSWSAARPISGGRGTLVGTLLGVPCSGSIGPALVFLGTQPQWEKAIQGLIILLAVASDALYREGE